MEKANALVQQSHYDFAFTLGAIDLANDKCAGTWRKTIIEVGQFEAGTGGAK